MVIRGTLALRSNLFEHPPSQASKVLSWHGSNERRLPIPKTQPWVTPRKQDLKPPGPSRKTRLPAPWERAKIVSQKYLVIAAYFDETWTRKVMANEKIGYMARRHQFNPRFEPIIRRCIPNKYRYRMDWVLKELADELSSFSMDPFDAEPEYNIHEEEEVVREGVERKKSSAYIPITSQPFVELKRTLLRKVQETFPPSKIVGKKPEGWLDTWSNLPERPSKLFSFATRGLPQTTLNDLEDARLALEKIGPARVNGFKLMDFRLKPGTQENSDTIVKYYPFKDCLDDFNHHPCV